jgi:hypothetical protein
MTTISNMEMKHVNNSTYPSLISNTDDVCILNIKKWNVSIYIGKKFQEMCTKAIPQFSAAHFYCAHYYFNPYDGHHFSHKKDMGTVYPPLVSAPGSCLQA